MQTKLKKQFKILIVEDDAFQRLALTDLFEMLDCIVVASINGLTGYQELLNTNETNKFDCIMLDYEMPEMDGLELIKLIKKNNQIKDVPVVVMMQYDMRQEIQASFMTEGALKFFEKPIRLANIKQILEELL